MYEINETQLTLVAGGFATMVIENYKPSYIVTGNSVYVGSSSGNNNLAGLNLYSNHVEDANGVTIFSGTGDTFAYNGLHYMACPVEGGNKYTIVF